MPGIVKRQQNKRAGISSGGSGGSVAQRNNNRNSNRNRNRNRGGPGGSGGGGGTGTTGDQSASAFGANNNTLGGWDNYWSAQGLKMGTDTNFDSWFNDNYYNQMLRGWQASNVGVPSGKTSDWSNYLAQNTNLAAMQNAFRRTDLTNQGLSGAGQARWQFF